MKRKLCKSSIYMELYARQMSIQIKHGNERIEMLTDKKFCKLMCGARFDSAMLLLMPRIFKAVSDINLKRVVLSGAST